MNEREFTFAVHRGLVTPYLKKRDGKKIPPAIMQQQYGYNGIDCAIESRLSLVISLEPRWSRRIRVEAAVE